MTYEPGPKFNPEGLKETDWKDELEEHEGLFDAVNANDRAEEIAKKARERVQAEEDNKKAA